MAQVSRGFRWGFAVLLAGLVLFLAVQPQAHAEDSKWRARYYNNKNVSGDPVFRRDESNIDHDWGNGGPGNGVSTDNFSARWTRSVNFGAGTYRFTATMDDGMRVWVDDRLIIDDWNDSQVRSRTADVYLDSGDHDLEVEYYEAGGVAVAQFSWVPIGAVQPPPVGSNQWTGQYYANRYLSGSPVMVRGDNAFNFNWGSGSPGGAVPSDNFSVRWTQSPYFNSGTYRFTASMDDGMRVLLDGRTIIDEWKDGANRTRTVDVPLNAGNHSVEVQYYEATGQAVAVMGWTQVGGGAPPPSTFGQWFGEYFANQSLSSPSTFTRLDNAINFNWGSGSPGPGIPNDHFSVRWSQTMNTSPGTYRVTATADDGVRVWVNGQLVINQWQENQNKTFQKDFYVPGGQTAVVVEYYENTGLAFVNVSLNYISGGGNPTPVAPQPPSLTGQQAVVAYANWLNLRSTPAVADNVITALPRGQVVTMQGRNGPWVLVVMPERNNLTGWVSGRYLQSIYPVGNLPLVEN